MKIVIVNSFFPPWRGGAETYAHNLSKSLAERGHDVAVVCGNDPLPQGVRLENGIAVTRLRILRRLYGTPIMLGLARELSRIDVDLFHANFPSPYIAFNVALASRLRAKPAVLTWHNDLPAVTSGARFLIETHDRFVLPNYIRAYRKVIATSKSYVKRSRILSVLSDLVTVVPNGVDCKHFRPQLTGRNVRNRFDLDDKFTLIFVGALTKWHRYKGLDVLLEALKRLVKTHPDLAVLIVGDGEMKHFYMSLTQRLGLAGNVIFVGDVPDHLLPQYYAASDALVLPSKDMSEGFGLTLLEANASGKPVIASNVGGIPSVVKNGYNGLLVQPNNSKALANAIIRLQRNPSKAHTMGRNGRRFAELHDWAVTASQTERVYEEAMFGRS